MSTAAGDGAGFHHMHRLDLLMCLYKRVFEFGPGSGEPCPITVHMDCRLTQLRQATSEVTATFLNGRTAKGEVLVGADGINSATLELMWPNARPRRWTEVTCFRGLVPRAAVAQLRKADGSPLDHNPIDSFSMDRHRNDKSGATTYWVRGGELLNVWIARYEPDSAAFEQEEGDWFPVNREEILREVDEAFTGSGTRDDLLALAGAIVRPTKWGLYDRDALETWVQGRICLLGDAAHPMLPTFGQGAAQSFEDAAALGSAFALHGADVATALLHYESVRHYRATRFQLGSKFAFDHLRAKDTSAQRALLEKLDERVSPAFAHDKRGGEDNSWIYAYDARNIGAKLPPKRTRTVGLPPRRQGRLRRHHPRSLEATCPRQGPSSRHARRGRAAQHARRLLDHHRGKGLRHHRVGTPSPWWRRNCPDVRWQGSHRRIR